MASEYSESWLDGPQSTKFYTRTYLPPPPTTPNAIVVFIHGFAEHVGRYTHFHPLLAKKGVAVFAVDQRGFGLTAQDTTGKKSKSSAYGKSCWRDQMEDIAWAVNHAKGTFPGLPIFLMGHSMGGGEVLGFVTLNDGPAKEAVSSLTGVIATSPLIHQSKPAPKLLRWIGGKISSLSPYTLVPADVNAEDLSHDEAFNSAYMKDPLIKQSGSLKGISDMLSKGEELLNSGCKRWPASLPLQIFHGTADKVTSHDASQKFHDAAPAAKKSIHLFEGGFHELQNEPEGVKEKLAEGILKFIDEHRASVATAPLTNDTPIAQTVAEPNPPSGTGPEYVDAALTKSNL